MGRFVVLLLLLIVAVTAFVAFLYLVVLFNRVRRERQDVYNAWAAVQVELQRRYYLVPQLVETVRGAAAHEAELLTTLSRRNEAAANEGFDAPHAARWDPPLVSAIQRVVALRERYPQLNSQQNFLMLQHELAMTEDRIAACRRYYNLQVRQLNDVIGVFPSNGMARLAGVGAAPYFNDPTIGPAR